MKYHIDTIPIWDAYEQKDECPLCNLEVKSEDGYIDSFLGGSVMEPATRIEVNKKGFCSNHFKMLYDAQNRLGLALITHTYLMETFKEKEELLKELKKKLPSRGFRLFSKKEAKDDPIDAFTNWLDDKVSCCIICERIDYTLKRYAYTIVHLWDSDPKFKDAFKSSKGFCMNHLSLLLTMAKERLSRKKQMTLLEDLIPLQIENMDRIDEELLWFTKKFDYQNRDKPWKNSKDALPRAIKKLSGIDVERED
ncbi:MAG: ABC transporter substrate-binding protein [Clostridiales bacterium]|nr:ABC transporter substrate-binding protein [Clostridiales bacterium]